jgi:hypothetical protein
MLCERPRVAGDLPQPGVFVDRVADALATKAGDHAEAIFTDEWVGHQGKTSIPRRPTISH